MQKIIAGFLKFQREVFPTRAGLFRSLANTQHPRTLFIACSDSRVIPELVTQSEPGELFVIRNADNIVPAHGSDHGEVSPTIEYAVAVLGVTDIVLCGHSGCGAMTAIARGKSLDHLPAVAVWLRHADAAKAITGAQHHHSDDEHLDALVHENVVAQLANLSTHPSVALALKQRRLDLHGWVFNIESGQIDAFDMELKRLTEHVWDKVDVLVTPTTPRTYKIIEVLQNPIELNNNLAYYTNFVNLLDLCAIAVPTDPALRVPPFGISFVAPSWNDEEISYLASDYMRLGEHLPKGYATTR